MTTRGHFGLLMAGGGTPADPFTAGLWSACSVEKLISGYAGSCLKARRSSDNATMDVGFDAGALDTTSLLAWSGSDSVYVERWYDQSGGANDFAQATTGKQPRIVNAGTPDGFLRFDGTDDIMASVNTSGGSLPAITAAFRAWSRANVNGLFVEKSRQIDVYNGFYVLSLNNGGTNVMRLAVSNNQVGSIGQATSWNATSNPTTSEAAWVVRYDRSLSTASNYAAWRRAWRDGTEQTVVYVGVTGSGGTDTAFADNGYYIGARDLTGAFPGQLNYKTLLLYHANKDVDVATITAAI